MLEKPHKFAFLVLFLVASGGLAFFLAEISTVRRSPLGLASRDLPECVTPRLESRVRTNDRTSNTGISSRKGEDHEALPIKAPMFISRSGRITTGAAEYINLSNDERVKVQLCIDDLFSNARNHFFPLVKSSSKELSSNPNEVKYHFSAVEDRGRSLRSEFESALIRAVGDEKYKKISTIMNFENIYAGFGKYDVDFEFYQTSRDPNTAKYRVQVSYSIPESGNVVRQWDTVFDKDNPGWLEDNWNGIFDFGADTNE